MAKKDVEFLLYNISLEHSAIIQYVFHSFYIKNKDIRSEIEEIARQEMRHLKWMAQKVYDLGSKVILKRDDSSIFINQSSIEDMLKANVNAEDMAINIYSSQISQFSDSSARKLMERVINDEGRHKLEFTKLLEEIKDEESNSLNDILIEKTTLETLQKLFDDEYKSILSYLHRFFNTKNEQEKEVLEDIAIESMVHMGWLGEHIGKALKLTQASSEIPSLDEEFNLEKLVDKDYKEAKEKLKDSPYFELLDNIDKEENYHIFLIEDLNKKMKKFTIGNLKDL